MRVLAGEREKCEKTCSARFAGELWGCRPRRFSAGQTPEQPRAPRLPIAHRRCNGGVEHEPDFFQRQPGEEAELGDARLRLARAASSSSAMSRSSTSRARDRPRPSRGAKQRHDSERTHLAARRESLHVLRHCKNRLVPKRSGGIVRGEQRVDRGPQRSILAARIVQICLALAAIKRGCGSENTADIRPAIGVRVALLRRRIIPENGPNVA
jgi:hypothetical protein